MSIIDNTLLGVASILDSGAKKARRTSQKRKTVTARERKSFSKRGYAILKKSTLRSIKKKSPGYETELLRVPKMQRVFVSKGPKNKPELYTNRELNQVYSSYRQIGLNHNKALKAAKSEIYNRIPN